MWATRRLWDKRSNNDLVHERRRGHIHIVRLCIFVGFLCMDRSGPCIQCMTVYIDMAFLLTQSMDIMLRCLIRSSRQLKIEVFVGTSLNLSTTGGWAM